MGVEPPRVRRANAQEASETDFDRRQGTGNDFKRRQTMSSKGVRERLRKAPESDFERRDGVFERRQRTSSKGNIADDSTDCNVGRKSKGCLESGLAREKIAVSWLGLTH